LESVGISSTYNAIFNISPYVFIARFKPDWVFAYPLSQARVVPAIQVLLQAGGFIQLLAGESE
jgi:hypothetical protein